MTKITSNVHLIENLDHPFPGLRIVPYLVEEAPNLFTRALVISLVLPVNKTEDGNNTFLNTGVFAICCIDINIDNLILVFVLSGLNRY